MSRYKYKYVGIVPALATSLVEELELLLQFVHCGWGSFVSALNNFSNTNLGLVVGGRKTSAIGTCLNLLSRPDESHSLQDFTGLPAVREAVAGGDPGILVLDLPIFQGDASLETLPHGLILQKHGIPSPVSVAVMEKLHKLSHVVFKNLSHAVELPWEKYLGEMHEFTAPGNDELRTVSLGEPLANEWSTLTIILSASHPQQSLVLFGAALSVFTEGMTSKPLGSAIDAGNLVERIGNSQGDWIVYYVRPNEDVFCTRTAGALMTPLSTLEYEERKRTKDLRMYDRRDSFNDEK